MNDNNKRRPTPKIDRPVQDRIGRELRKLYEDLLRQPLPEKLVAPLRAFDEVQTARQRLQEAVQAMRRVSPGQTSHVTGRIGASLPLSTQHHGPALDASRKAKEA